MFKHLSAVVDLFRKGSEVANVEKWKANGISAAALSAFVLALVTFGSSFGVDIPIDADQANGLATGVIALVGVLLPIITSKRAGILPAKSEPDGQRDTPGPEPVRPVESPAAPTDVQPVRSPLDGLDTTYFG